MEHKKLTVILQMNGKEDTISGTSIIGVAIDEDRKEQTGSGTATKGWFFTAGKPIPPEKVLDILAQIAESTLTHNTFKNNPALAYGFLYQLGSDLQKTANEKLHGAPDEDVIKAMIWLSGQYSETQRELKL